ncbi:RNA-binding ribosome biosynthesis protein mak21 [Exophiala dermatitidis]|nr:RNA-binding ribosome biosynthesis protein mak21 [Exophiala dermatitidis]KAJ4683162.1 RNA-binding ribosome biosynthesis protein mak21 [Exophiala dermatitidis]KAJ4698935.1 RNA-binding ribosome biosynthesis protein mak21 [Exophiala dermatitidis]
MSKVASRSGASSAPVPDKDGVSKSTENSSAPSMENLRNQIQARLQEIDQKGKKGKKDVKKTDVTPKSGKQSKHNTEGPGRGKKRDRNGQVLEDDKKKNTSRNSVPQHGGKINDDDEEEEENDFRKEVQALGGTADDIQLVADAQSDSELEGTSEERTSRKSKADVESKVDMEGLDKGLKNILKEIALAQGEMDDEEDEDEDEVDEVDEAPSSRQPPKEEQKQEKEKPQRGKNTQFVCEPNPDWFDLPAPEVDTEAPLKYTPSKDTLDQLYEYAKKLLEEENQRFKDSQQSSSAHSFYNTVITSGTLSDKISALTLAVQESPLHNMRALETLIGVARKRSRSQAIDVLRALKDLFAQGSLLPESRRLYAFRAQPLLPHVLSQIKTWRQGDKLPRGLEPKHLVAWAFEDWLKEQYFEILKILEVWCNDEIEFSKARAVSYVYELLKERPEQESNLLRLLINKLGDPVKKIASQASYLLMQLLISHPAMKEVVISAIESDFIFRPGQSLHGKYYAVVTLNQTVLSPKEEAVAQKLLDIYFALFTQLLKPSTAATEEKTEEEPRTRGLGKKSKNTPKSGQAQTEELKEKLTSAILTGVNRAYPYVGAGGTTFSDHMETLFKIAHSPNFNTSIQALLLIQRLSGTHRASNDRFYRVLYESLLDPRLIHASKQQLYLNLLHRALKADLNVKRVKAFVKRLIQVLSLHEPPFICGSFFLIQDLETTFPSLAGLIDQPEDHDDDVEVFRDVDEDANNDLPEKPEQHQSNVYDGHKRAPEHANADNSCAWELLPFLAHFHPSVSVSADHILRHAKLPGKPDLSLHTLSHFLDRFVYRNPKLSSSSLRGSSIMQPMAATDIHGVLIANGVSGQRQLPVNSDAFKSKKSDEVAAEDVFFHQYFASLGKGVTKKTKAQKKREKNEDDESAEEDEVWKAMMDSAPDLEGEVESDEDVDLSDLESAMGESEGEGLSGSEGEGVDIEAGIFDEDEDDLMELDEDVADEGGDFAGFESGEEEDQRPSKRKKGKKGAKEDEGKAKTKKTLKGLPTFASAEDYAKMLENDEDEDK